jgi:prevent-host-death family protein
MRTANIGEFKDNLSKFLGLVERGEALTVCKRNVPVARVIPCAPSEPCNQTRLGCGQGTVQIHGDLTEPLIPVDQWAMHRQ